MKSALWTLVSIVLLALFGFVIHPYFQALSFSQFKAIHIQALDLGTQFQLRVLFCAAMAFIPILFFAMKKMLRLTTQRQQFFALAAILISGIIFWQFKIYSLNMRYEELMKVKIMHYYFALEDLRLEMYLLIGFILGAVIGSISLHRSSKRLQ